MAVVPIPIEVEGIGGEEVTHVVNSLDACVEREGETVEGVMIVDEDSLLKLVVWLGAVEVVTATVVFVSVLFLGVGLTEKVVVTVAVPVGFVSSVERVDVEIRVVDKVSNLVDLATTVDELTVSSNGLRVVGRVVVTVSVLVDIFSLVETVVTTPIVCLEVPISVCTAHPVLFSERSLRF